MKIGDLIEELKKYDNNADVTAKINGNDEFCFLIINEVYGNNETGVIIEVE